MNKELVNNSKGDASEDRIFDLWVLLGRTYHLISRAREKEMRDYGIGHIQGWILFIIKSLKDKATPSEISRYTAREKHTVSEILTRMVEKGLIKKVEKPNIKGSVRIKLTAKGEKAYEVSLRRVSINRIMSNLSREQHLQLKSCLQTLLNSARDELQVDDKLLMPPSEISQ